MASARPWNDGLSSSLLTSTIRRETWLFQVGGDNEDAEISVRKSILTFTVFIVVAEWSIQEASKRGI